MADMIISEEQFNKVMRSLQQAMAWAASARPLLERGAKAERELALVIKERGEALELLYRTNLADHAALRELCKISEELDKGIIEETSAFLNKFVRIESDTGVVVFARQEKECPPPQKDKTLFDA